MMRIPVLLMAVLGGMGVLAQEGGTDPVAAGIRVEARCLRNPPKEVEGIGEVHACALPLDDGQAAVIRFGKMEALIEDWEPVPSNEPEPPAEPGAEPPRFRPVLGDPLLLGIELTLSVQFKGALIVVGKTVYRRVDGYSEIVLDKVGRAGAVGKMPRIIESETAFQLMPPRVSATNCTLALPGEKPILLEIRIPEMAK